jgi:hypothetical protein
MFSYLSYGWIIQPYIYSFAAPKKHSKNQPFCNKAKSKLILAKNSLKLGKIGPSSKSLCEQEIQAINQKGRYFKNFIKAKQKIK